MATATATALAIFYIYVCLTLCCASRFAHAHEQDTPTSTRLEADEQLSTLVIAMMRASGSPTGAAASYALRERYGHFLSYADGKKPSDCRSYCPDLAFVLGEMYCTHTLHVPGQTAANYTWWAAVYMRAINASRMNLPHSVASALLARAYACLMSCSERPESDTKNQEADTRLFLTCWITLRAVHANMFGHTAYLMLACKSYPLLGVLTVRMHKEIFALEQQMKLAQLERERKEHEERMQNE